MALATGARLGGYEVLGALGSGGMGEVYRAKDVRLGREVALKVLPLDIAGDADRRARFEREARAASALNHPNIVTIHALEQAGEVAFIVMERVEGRTLREVLRGGPLPAPTVLALASQLAGGLVRAHEAGIVHRDLKPENVMVTADGLAKILDFGLAKVGPAGAPDPTQETAELSGHATETGVVMGTVGYMAPEQATGRVVDHRADQFALGAILYEMATGRRAFQRATLAESLAAVLRDEPEPMARVNPGAPPGLAAVVERCLRKGPSQRYARTRELLDALQAAGRSRPSTRRAAAAAVAVVLAAGAGAWMVRRPPAPAGEPTLVVLPLRAIGAEDYFADGVTESLRMDVARIPGVLVIGRDAAFRYKGRPIDAPRVAAELGVRYVLQGSVQRQAERLRVSAELIDGATGYTVWSDRFDREVKDVFAVQDEISRDVVTALQLELSAGARTPPTASMEALDAYLRGRSFAERFDWDEKDRSIPLFEQAIALDPGFAAAHAELAAQYQRKSFTRDPDRSWESKAFVEIGKAMALDPRLASPWITRGNLSSTLANRFEYEKAIADYDRALALEPGSSEARASRASALTHVGQLDRAQADYELALRSAPGEPAILMRLARIRLYRGDAAGALRELQRSGENARSWQTVLALAALGRADEARALGAELVVRKADADTTAALAVALARSGDRAGAEAQVGRSIAAGEGSSHFHHAMQSIADVQALLGNRAEAVRWLRRAADEGLPCAPAFENDPQLQALRGDVAFERLLADIRARTARFAAGS